MKMSYDEFERAKTEEPISESWEDHGRVTDPVAGSPESQLWSTFLRKLVRALAATLLGGTLIYFICRWLIM
ncbi:MAG: hypothetical protein GY941_24780 [Planctomycetes bacterium]|nr:hypothetical protein [Planctomycetota bacterium]